ncbi:MAG: hypothetical protein Q8K60_08785 [Parachlamydiaceae bacterium]|nr:hypothetical protein [Parachlamydiaceae bacterium]
MKFKVLFLIIFFVNPLIALLNLEDFEDKSIILEMKQIYLPQHPFAFNPSIVKWKGEIFLCFREIIPSENYMGSRIGICQLDEKFNPIGCTQVINGIENFGLQDARLFSLKDRLFLIYSAGCKNLVPIPNQHSGVNCRMYIAELVFENDQFIAINNECLSKFENVNSNRAEKNWIPFEYSENLLFAYTLSPHRILFPHLSEGKCTTLYETKGNIYWPWGELRGGSQSILDDDQYISFFHSISFIKTTHSHGENIPHYFIGAYTHSKEPPFEITAISPHPIIGKGFYSGKIYTPYWHPVRVVFVYGLICEHDCFWISYGRQDHEMWIAKLDKKALLKSLKPIQTEE